MYSGPVLALEVSGDDSPLFYSCGPYLRTSRGPLFANSLPLLSSGQSIHGIRATKNLVVVFGSRQLCWCPEAAIADPSQWRHVLANDWVLAAISTDEYIIAVTMQNRLEVFCLCTGERMATIEVPDHALLYSADLMVDPGKGTITVFGGGVLSNMHIWSVDLVFGCENILRANIVTSSVLKVHKGSIFRARLVESVWTNNSHPQLITTSDDRSAILWELSDEWRPKTTFRGHLARVWDARVVSESLLATACEDGLVRLFDLSSGECMRELRGHSRDVRTLVPWNRDGCPGLVSAGEDGCVKFWRIGGTDQPRYEYTMDKDCGDWIRGVHFLKTQNFSEAVWVTNNGRIYRFDGERVVCVRERIGLGDHQQTTPSVTTSSLWEFGGKKFFIVGFVGGHVELFDLDTGLGDVKLNVVPNRVVSLFGVRDRFVVAFNHGGEGAMIEFVPREDRVPNITPFSINMSAKVTSVLCLSDLLILGNDRGYLQVFRIGAGNAPPTRAIQRLSSLKLGKSEKVTSIEQSPFVTHEILCHSSNGFSIRVFVNACSGDAKILSVSRRPTLSYLVSENAGFCGTDFCVSNRAGLQWQVDCGGHRRPFDFWEFKESNTQRFVLTYATQNKFVVCRGQSTCSTIVQGINAPDMVHSMSGLGEGGNFAMVAEDGSWSLTNSSFENSDSKSIHHETGALRAVACKGDWIVCGGAKSKVFAYKVMDPLSKSIELIHEISLQTDDDVRVMGIALQYRDETLTAYIIDSATNLYFWRLPHNSIERMTHLIPSPMTFAVLQSVCVSADGNHIFVGSGNGYVAKMSTSEQDESAALLHIHQCGVNAIAVVGHKYIATVSDDQSLAIVDAQNMQEVAKVGHASSCSIRAIAVAGDSCTIATTGTDRRVSVWTLVYDEHGQFREIILMKRIPTAVSEPQAILFTDNDTVCVAGRGIETLETGTFS